VAVTQQRGAGTLDVERIKADFPILERTSHGKRLVYLDSANTSQKPRKVIDTITEYYERHNANLYRAVYELAEEATAMFEAAIETMVWTSAWVSCGPVGSSPREFEALIRADLERWTAIARELKLEPQ